MSTTSRNMLKVDPLGGVQPPPQPQPSVKDEGSVLSKVSNVSKGKLIDIEARKAIRQLEESYHSELDVLHEDLLKTSRQLEALVTFINVHEGMEIAAMEPAKVDELRNALAEKQRCETVISYLRDRERKMKEIFERRKNNIIADAEDDKEKYKILQEEEQDLDNEEKPNVDNIDSIGNVDNWLNRLPPPPGNTQQFKKDPEPQPDSGGLVSMEALVEALGKAIGGGVEKNQQRPVILKAPVDKKLPVFSGNPGEWCTFVAAFDRTTTKYKFDNGENLHRLREALKGDAKSAVEHLMANVNNVDKILEVLEKRFGRAELVLDYLVDRVKECKSPEMSKAETVVAFGTAIDSLMTNIIAFNEDEYLCNKQLVTDLARKLPTIMKNNWFVWKAENPTRKSNLRDFMRWLTPYVDGAILQLKPEVKTGEKPAKKTDERRLRGPAGAVQAVAGENSTPKVKSCVVCSRKGHELEKCWSFPKKGVQERWQLVKKAKACYRCLQAGHRTAECHITTFCGVDGCTKKHHTLLHSASKPKKEDDVPSEDEGGGAKHDGNSSADEDEKKEIKKTGTVGVTVLKGADGPLAIVPVKLRGPSGVRKTYALLDTGASHTLMEKRLADELGLDGNHLDYLYYGASGTAIKNKDSMEVNCEIRGDFKGAPYFQLKKVYTIPKTGIPPYSINVDELKRKWRHLRKVKGASLVHAEPQLIIGNDHGKLIAAREVVEASGDTPIATRCKLGWVVSGRIRNSSKSGVSYAITGVCNGDDVLHNMVKEFFSTESFGVVRNTKNPSSTQDERAHEILQKSAKKTGNAWEVGLLWAEDNIQFPKSRSEAYKRLIGIERRMAKDEEFAMAYQGKFEEYTEKGYITKLTDDHHDGDSKYYIPHFSVFNPNKPGKTRLVFDAASRAKGVSLNDKLLKGPDLIRPLTSVLMNFRRHLYVISGDITDMFHRVNVISSDRDAQRFLWRNGDAMKPPDVYQMNVLIFGATSSPASAIFIKNRNADDYGDLFPEAVKAIKDDFYVDDCLTGGQTVENVIELRQQITDVCQQGNFEVGKWISNSVEVMESIPANLRAHGTKEFQEKSLLPAERVLGMWWDPKDYTFSFICKYNKVSAEIMDGKRPTKRELCRLVMSIYDPLGFVSHFKIQGIILLQATWRTGIGWDDEVSDAIYESWKMWLQNLTDIVKVKVPRCLCAWLNEAENVELHVFVDASEDAFSAVCYLRLVKDSQVEVIFVASKCRVAPLRKLSIPRLELQAAVLGVRLATMVVEEGNLNVTQRTFWSDSQTVLSWIRSESGRFKEFVRNRIGEIHESSNVHEWRWIPTGLNVADLATRVNVVADFDPFSVWYSGPSFLKTTQDRWPVERKRQHPDDIDDEELRMGIVANVSLTVTSSCLPKPSNFSNYNRLIRATAAVKVAADFWIAKGKKQNPQPRWEIEQNQWKSSIAQRELDNAEKLLIQEVQTEAYADEKRKLESKLSLDRKSKLWRLSPYLDAEGIIRVRGRIGAADVNIDIKQPIILPSRHPFTDLLIDREHVLNAHCGQSAVLNNLRQRFWIVDGRQAVKKSWTRCWSCKLGKVSPLIPEMGALPHYRLAYGQPPFTFTGTDYFGPFEVTVGRRHEKRWVALFTCMVTRAVHMEVVHNMSTDETLMALCRFIDTRGRPRYIYSDNGTNYVGAANELKLELKKIDWNSIQCDGKFYGVQWFFIPPAAPHMGGAWERLVGAVKKVMMRTLHEKYPKDTTFLTVVKAAEAIVNDRPLSYVSADHNDPESLTPNHFLRGSANHGPTLPVVLDPRDEFLRVQWKKAQIWTNELWDRWTKEYLPSLLTRDKWHQNNEPLQVGDVVIVVDNQQPRNMWKRGIIVKTFVGSDDQVRVVEVETVDAATAKKTKYKRPVSKICPVGLRVGFGDNGVDPKSGTGMSGRV